MPSTSFPPQRAPVAPRARRLPEGACLPLQRIIHQLIQQSATGTVQLGGGDGAGKLTALRHLASVCCPDRSVECSIDATSGLRVSRLPLSPRLSIVSGDDWGGPCTIQLQLSNWSDDDLIEYLLAVHPAQCRSVMQRVQADPERARLAGNPELWAVVLDEMAADESMRFVLSALRRRVWRLRSIAAARQHWGAPVSDRVFESETLSTRSLPRLMRHALVELLVHSEKLSDQLAEGRWPSELAELSRELVAEVALLVRSRPAAIEQLERMLWLNELGTPNVASILAATDPAFRPRLAAGANLCGATLAQVRWAGIRLSGAVLDRADLHRSDLSDAILESVHAYRTNFRFCSMRAARLTGLDARKADFFRTDLTAAMMDGARLDAANLERALLNGAHLRGARLMGANLRAAALVAADLSWAHIAAATLDHADLTRANLTAARLEHLRLADAELDYACLREAALLRCDLEGLRATGVDFAGAELSGSLLTGSQLLGASFRDARLRDCALADVDWEGADLRGADLRGSTFHLGSSRSGLVGSTVPCEGSKTGFYTDEYAEQDYKSPEEIRHANLRGADVRKAKISGVDFYLVDLRDARYTPKQARHFRRCGAVL